MDNTNHQHNVGTAPRDQGLEMKMKHEYNEDVIGYVVTREDGRSANFQFELPDSNHPQPKHYLAWGCEGDDTHRQFTEDELCEMSDYLKSQEDVRDTVKAFNKAFYKDGEWDMPYPLSRHHIFEAAEGEE